MQSGSPACLNKGTFHYANGKASNNVSLDFNGTRIKYWFVQYSSMGKARVKIDGVLVATVNLTGNGQLDCKSWFSAPLAPGDHTIQVLGKKGGRVSIDVFTIFQ